MRRMLLTTSLFCAASFAHAHADDPAPVPIQPQQQMVVTATRVATPVEDIPAGVSVVDRQTMQERNYTTLVDALASLPGLRVSQSGGPGGNASVFVRGNNSDAVLVLLDGMPINDASDTGAAFNFGVDTLGDIERIEVIRGPMAALYGSGAIGGVINLITRRGVLPGVHVTGDLQGGYPAQILGNVNAAGVEGKWDYMLNFETQSQTGFDTTPQRESVYTGTPQGFRDRVGTLNLGFSPVAGTRIGLLLRARQALFGFNALGDPTFDDDNSNADDVSLIGRIGGQTTLFGGTLESGLFLGRVQDDRRYQQYLNPLDPNMASGDSRYHGYRTDLQWNNTVHLSDLFQSKVLSATDLTYGYEYIQDTAKVRVNTASGGFPFMQNIAGDMTTNAGYAGLQTTLWNRVTLTGQLRQDSVLNDTPFTWRLGGVVAVPELATHFKAAYGTAFRAPSLFDRFGVDSFGYVGNPNLLPERAQGWEAGFSTDVPAFGRPDFASVSSTYFNEQVEDLITTVFAPVYTSVNIGSAHIQGVENALTLRPARWLSVTAAYTYTDAQNADTDEQLVRRPRNTASLNATIVPLPNLTIAPELLYTGAFPDFLVDDNGNSTANIVGNQQGLIVNLTITYALTPRVSLFANARNLFNSRFEPVNGYQTPGASALAGVRFKL